MFTLRFWNGADECMMISGKYSRDFDTEEDAWSAAYALIKHSHRLGAVGIDINGYFYDIVED